MSKDADKDFNKGKTITKFADVRLKIGVTERFLLS